MPWEVRSLNKRTLYIIIAVELYGFYIPGVMASLDRAERLLNIFGPPVTAYPSHPIAAPANENSRGPAGFADKVGSTNFPSIF